MTLREVLHAHIPMLTVENTVRDATDAMDIYLFPGVVIVDKDRAPVGVLTEGDVCRAAGSNDSFVSVSSSSVSVYMTPDPTCLSPDTEVGEAFHVMLRSGLTLLPVVEDDKLSGIVTRSDLMHALMLDVACRANP